MTRHFTANWGIVVLTAGAALLHLRHLATEDPWFDEVFSILTTAGSLGDLWRLTIADQVHPPGFYLVLWGWTRIGGVDLAWLRLLPALMTVAAVPALVHAARVAGLSERSALLAGALAAVSPLLLAMSRELRMYAPLALITILTLLAILGDRPRHAAVGHVILASLHYFGILASLALVTGAIAAERRRWRPAVFAILPAGALLALWLWAVARAAPNGIGVRAGWIPTPDLDGILALPLQLVGGFGTGWGTIGVLMLMGMALLSARHTPSLRPALSLALVPPLLILLGGAVSGRPLWVVRYLIITGPAWWLLIASAVDRAPRSFRGVATFAVLGWATISGLRVEALRPRKTAWSTVALRLAGPAGRTLCAHDEYLAMPLRYQIATRDIPLRLVAAADCTASSGATGYLVRPETPDVRPILIGRGARPGAPEALGTSPNLIQIPLTW